MSRQRPLAPVDEPWRKGGRNMPGSGDRHDRPPCSGSTHACHHAPALGPRVGRGAPRRPVDEAECGHAFDIPARRHRALHRARPRGVRADPRRDRPAESDAAAVAAGPGRRADRRPLGEVRGRRPALRRRRVAGRRLRPPAAARPHRHLRVGCRLRQAGERRCHDLARRRQRHHPPHHRGAPADRREDHRARRLQRVRRFEAGRLDVRAQHAAGAA